MIRTLGAMSELTATTDRTDPEPVPPSAGRTGRWCLGTKLMVTATAGWAAFVVAHRLISGRTPMWAPFDMLPPLVFVAVPVVLMVIAPLARPVRWRLLIALAVTVAIGWPVNGLNPGTLWYTPPAAPAGAIRVVSWNTEFWDQDWRTAGRTTTPDFYAWLRSFDADVYLLKEYLRAKPEAATQAWTADLAIRVDATAELAREFPGYQVAVAGEQITLSRLPIVSHTGLDMQPYLPAAQRDVPPALADFAESFTVETLRTDIQVGDRVVSFYNAQPHQPPTQWQLWKPDARDADRYNFNRRAASFRVLRQDIEANPNPVVIGADLNTSPSMGTRRWLPSGLDDNRAALSSVYPATWNDRGAGLWQIDWFLTGHGARVNRYQLPDAGGRSDHRPQVVTLSVDR